MEIKGKKAIVTGGSRGIGRAIALELAKRGANVGINYVSNEAKARETLSEIERFGVKGILLKGDVSRIEDVKNFVKKFVEEFKKVDILINNAGILSKNINFLDVSEEEWNRVIDVNLKGTFLVTKESLPFIPDGGKIINMSSIAGKMGGTVGAHYAASKSGVIGLTFALASELAKRKITVNAIAPGPVDTELITEEIKERLSKVTPLGRIATPEEIAKTAIFLIENDFVDGEVIDVNGARYMD